MIDWTDDCITVIHDSSHLKTEKERIAFILEEKKKIAKRMNRSPYVIMLESLSVPLIGMVLEDSIIQSRLGSKFMAYLSSTVKLIKAYSDSADGKVDPQVTPSKGVIEKAIFNKEETENG